MTWTRMMTRGLWIGLSTTLLCTSGCAHDGKNVPPEEEVDGSVGGHPSGMSSLDAGFARMDSAILPPVTTDGGSFFEPLADAGPIAPDTTVTSGDGGTRSLLPALPPGVTLRTDGNSLSACYGEDDCMGDNLSCVHSLGLVGAGYCYSTCKSNDDCQPLEGVATLCSIEGQCVLDCTGGGLGDGPCPTNMVCRDIVPGLAVPIFRCEYPYGSGGKITPDYGQCDQGHGSNDCKDDLFCYVPISGIVTAPEGPGYCAPGCSDASDCTVPGGATAKAACSLLGRCEMDCNEKGSTCPAGMDCVDADNAPLITTRRCRYPQ
ncbi:MAG: hypothetical protein JWN48_3079 [Myxococcaceae bacterium]|nr:hypothetical protein [Myxococcaceae bacterium]